MYQTMYHTMYMKLGYKETPCDSANFVILIKPSQARSNAGAIGGIHCTGQCAVAQTCIIPTTSQPSSKNLNRIRTRLAYSITTRKLITYHCSQSSGAHNSLLPLIDSPFATLPLISGKLASVARSTILPKRSFRENHTWPNISCSSISAYISSAEPIISTIAQLVFPLNVLLQTRTTATLKARILCVSSSSSRLSLSTV